MCALRIQLVLSEEKGTVEIHAGCFFLFLLFKCIFKDNRETEIGESLT